MEGYLPPMWCLLWTVISLAVIIYGIMQLRKTVKDNPEFLALYGLSGVFMLILSSITSPSVTGSCSHPCGNAPSTVFFGPSSTALITAFVLFFQAIIFAHGGITTLGANIFSMGIVGPFCGYIVWKALRSANISAGVSMFFTAFVADLLTYVTTAVELTLAFPGADPMATLTTFLGVFAVTQIPLAIAEGLLSTVIYNYIQDARPDILVKFGVISEKEAGAN
jgi:cobalt/nickel transport system permease protein